MTDQVRTMLLRWASEPDCYHAAHPINGDTILVCRDGGGETWRLQARRVIESEIGSVEEAMWAAEAHVLRDIAHIAHHSERAEEAATAKVVLRAMTGVTDMNILGPVMDSCCGDEEVA